MAGITPHFDESVIREARGADLVALVSQHVQLKFRGGDWWGLCPFHMEKTPSFHVTRLDSTLIFKCFGCGKAGDAIEWLHLAEQLEFRDAVAKLSGRQFNGKYTRTFFAGIETRKPTFDKEAEGKFVRAKQTWENAQPIRRTHGHDYLKARGIRVPPSAELRFSPREKHSTAKSYFPAVIARLSDDRGFRAIQRIYLNETAPMKAPVDDPKRTLGAMHGSAVRLSTPTQGFLALAEGVETAMSAAQLYAIPVWAVCGQQRFTKVDIPADVSCLTIFGDQTEDTVDPQTGEVTEGGKTCAFRAQDFWDGRGKRVEVIFPAAHFDNTDESTDFNNLVAK